MHMKMDVHGMYGDTIVTEKGVQVARPAERLSSGGGKRARDEEVPCAAAATKADSTAEVSSCRRTYAWVKTKPSGFQPEDAHLHVREEAWKAYQNQLSLDKAKRQARTARDGASRAVSSRKKSS